VCARQLLRALAPTGRGGFAESRKGGVAISAGVRRLASREPRGTRLDGEPPRPRRETLRACEQGDGDHTQDDEQGDFALDERRAGKRGLLVLIGLLLVVFTHVPIISRD
jgi:hypothetical protein